MSDAAAASSAAELATLREQLGRVERELAALRATKVLRQSRRYAAPTRVCGAAGERDVRLERGIARGALSFPAVFASDL